MKIHDCEQRSPEWFEARLGRLTASDCRDAFATVKSGEAAGRKRVRAKLVVERLTGICQDDGYINAAMQRGLDLEPAALAAYEAHTGLLVGVCGFVSHDDLMIGCSPDGVMDGLTAGVELKVPLIATHIGYLRGHHGVPSEYLPQVMHSLLVTGATWWDFVSFAPELPDHLRLFHVRLQRQDVDMSAHLSSVKRFLAEVNEEEQALRTMANPSAQLQAAVEALA